MYQKLLHIILLVSVVWLFPSCTTDVIDDGDIVPGSEMQFVVPGLSRASVATNLSYNGSRFVVYGDMRYNENPKTTIFDKAIVEYNDGKWGYGNPQYWFPKFEHSFIAMHPVDPAGMSGAQYYDSQLSFTYTLPDDFERASDLVVATHRRKVGVYSSDQLNAPDFASVYLNFWHIMSRLNFVVKNDGAADNIKVTKIVLEGVNKTGAFAITPAPLLPGSTQTDDYTYSWSASDPGTLTANISVDVAEDKESPLFPDGNALFMVPQPDNNGVVLRVTYTMYDGTSQPEEMTLAAEVPIGGWKPGKIYTYTLFIEEKSTEIYLTVSVKNWQTPDSANVVVPES